MERNSLKNSNRDIQNREYRIVISPIARNMIYELADYIAIDLCDIEAAIKMKNSLIAFIRGMSVLPQRFLYDKNKFLKQLGIRKAIYKNYIVYLWIDELYMTVNILGAFHTLTSGEHNLKEMFRVLDIKYHPSRDITHTNTKRIEEWDG